MNQPLLEVQDLSIEFSTRRGKLKAVDELSFTLQAGKTLGIVGESGCGKSITSLALMGLLPPNGRRTAKLMRFDQTDLLSLTENKMQKMRGADLAMIFQDPMSSLNPSFTVGFQLGETLRIHENLKSSQILDRSIELLHQVGIPAPETRLHNYPHQLSGGMCQRIMIAIAIACRPKLLIADEPTTALDVTIQAQILNLIQSLQKKNGMALILITHDLGIVSKMADDLLVMYAGQAVEYGPLKSILQSPTHPYTHGLLSCLPASHSDSDHRSRLPTITGMVPDLVHRPSGCQLHPRCSYVQEKCKNKTPDLIHAANLGLSKCFYPLNSSVQKDPHA